MGLHAISITCAQREHNTAAGGLTLQDHPHSRKGSLRGRPGPSRPPGAPTQSLKEMPPMAGTPGPRRPAPGLRRQLPQPLRRAAGTGAAHTPAQCASPASPKGSGRARPGTARFGTRGRILVETPFPVWVSKGLPAPRRLARKRRVYMATLDSAVCNAERQLTLRRYKPALPYAAYGAGASSAPAGPARALPAA